MSVKVGEKAPEFKGQAVVNGEFKDIKLSDFQGKWVVLFFWPLDFTFVCSTEIRGFNEHYGEFKKLGAEVVGASTDSVYTHKAWIEHGLGDVQFPLLSDTSLEVSDAYDVLVKDKGIALRGTFIIDPEGIVRSYTINDLDTGRSITETLRTL
ncbi:MAG: redoxin domain-containing protein [Candidatus Latescibacteria bacterium]|nr:redoxin domain-containing protein [Candidatus Latescibacterota bacterium]NIM64510.1 redoxin domain-containing protein [Candidatus Latescibacterota bacterium]NIO00663.1 redoxin domain-containing protein [Candidatus Latescibacterota bacterium]NIO27066.1 redoxin domain-containing protein [Candidatus Latescibacterota bacterium]NIO54590.1 redoxin domain-containing protein [Candidatus Latescibacterota bacterium]